VNWRDRQIALKSSLMKPFPPRKENFLKDSSQWARRFCAGGFITSAPLLHKP